MIEGMEKYGNAQGFSAVFLYAKAILCILHIIWRQVGVRAFSGGIHRIKNTIAVISAFILVFCY